MATKKSSKKIKKTKVRPSKYSSSKRYSSRPLWQWIVIYAIIGSVVYGFVYYLVIAPKGAADYTSPKTVDQNYDYKFE